MRAFLGLRPGLRSVSVDVLDQLSCAGLDKNLYRRSDEPGISVVKQCVASRGQALKEVVSVIVGFGLALEVLSHQEQSVFPAVDHWSVQLAPERGAPQQGDFQRWWAGGLHPQGQAE